MSKTLFLLMAEFDGRAAVPITEVAPRYFGDNNKNVILRKANNRDYPVVFGGGVLDRVFGCLRIFMRRPRILICAGAALQLIVYTVARNCPIAWLSVKTLF